MSWYKIARVNHPSADLVFQAIPWCFVMESWGFTKRPLDLKTTEGAGIWTKAICAQGLEWEVELTFKQRSRGTIHTVGFKSLAHIQPK